MIDLSSPPTHLPVGDTELYGIDDLLAEVRLKTGERTGGMY